MHKSENINKKNSVEEWTKIPLNKCLQNCLTLQNEAQCFYGGFLSIHSFSILLILHMVTGEPGAYPSELGHKDRVPTHYNAQSHAHSDTFFLAFK